MDRHATAPFVLRLFYRTGAFHRPDEFNVGTRTEHLPPHLTLQVWPDCTLTELSHQLAAAAASGSSRHDEGDDARLLPDPAIGTRLVFRLIFADFRGAAGPPDSSSSASGGAGRFSVKDLGSVVIGEGGRGLDVSDLDALEDVEMTVTADDACGHGEPGGRATSGSNKNSNGNTHNLTKKAELELGSEGSKTLAEARLVPGDYISCAILPPLEDGSVAPASAARTGRGYGAGEARAVGAAGPPPLRGGSSHHGSGNRAGRGHDWARDRHLDRRDSGGYGGRHGDGRRRSRGGGPDDGGRRYGERGETNHFGDDNKRGVPMGEWRRGEALPTVPRGEWRRGEDLHGYDAAPSRGRGSRRW
ncbi:Sin3 associated polypeptide p18-domain-containing protein [Microdochium trichocladiopsis]|uniref:Sin3 associated polypeptide p18-domain-containing protein n=1 Tax=Microdochium trichocladiopsis TaxID=1682393 RepID=A0A9P8YJA6_9PEZI|nr:Sin3 associated polypeptide p18-domain-containing protein [Microdochium trichocladiopsis]KAH7041315.1 Sin3 associated polypeptide p18-domain-containing protein [Microdochium trichocladiopsis]